MIAINDGWPEFDWTQEDGTFQKKWSSTDLPPPAARVAAAIDPEWISKITGIQDLEADESLFGAGLHCIPKGGFLNMHCDFNVHPDGRLRRVNCLIYLNLDWNPEWGGELILADSPHLKKAQDIKKVAPIGGRCVIFETNSQTWHGHPIPLNCPEGIQRRSLALYFYTREKTREEPRSTVYAK